MGAYDPSSETGFSAKPVEEFADEGIAILELGFHRKAPCAEAFKEFDMDADGLFFVLKQGDKYGYGCKFRFREIIFGHDVLRGECYCGYCAD